MRDARWTIIIPVKRLSIGKSRLRGAPADDALVLAIALDTIDAARESDAVDRVFVGRRAAQPRLADREPLDRDDDRPPCVAHTGHPPMMTAARRTLS